LCAVSARETFGAFQEWSNCLAGQAEICCQERLSRNIALRILLANPSSSNEKSICDIGEVRHAVDQLANAVLELDDANSTNL